MKIKDGGEAPVYTNPDMFTLEVHHGGYFVDGLYTGGIVQWVDGQDADKLFVLYITDNPAPRPLNVQSPVFSAQGENAEHYEDEHTAPGYDGDEENGQHEFLDVEIDEEFGEAEEEVEVESDEAEQGGEDEEEDGDFIDSKFEQSDEEDNMNFHRYVVTEEQDDGHKEPGEGDTDGYNTSDLESLHEDSEDEDGKKRGLRKPKFKQYNKQHDLLDPKFHSEGQEGEDESEDKLEDYPWLLYDAHVGKGPTVRVKTYHPIHTCGRSQKTRFATSQWLAKRFDEDLRTNHNMSVAEFMTLVMKHYSIDVTRDQCYKAKNLAKERIQGSIEEQYSKLWDYCEELSTAISSLLHQIDEQYQRCEKVGTLANRVGFCHQGWVLEEGMVSVESPCLKRRLRSNKRGLRAEGIEWRYYPHETLHVPFTCMVFLTGIWMELGKN
ncbi:hypothetical protein L3X38_013255 [Prunus dulcis]|uniref:Uncharacterized protein n=1 Tax=Prunus dulcis TaxID=3755 RepID=A0AAD4WKW0_PRUDU|nr:hypothetical protein L3X38_013255 [Prunus dulcis]